MSNDTKTVPQKIVPKAVSEYMASIGRIGGASKSKKKLKALKKNSRLGGWKNYWRRKREKEAAAV